MHNDITLFFYLKLTFLFNLITWAYSYLKSAEIKLKML